MTESNSSVMRIILLDQNMTVESSHFRNCEDTDGTEGFGCYRKNLALCHISAELAVCGTLQTIESDVARCDISLEGSLGYLFRKGSCHNELVFHRAESQFSGAGISAVEAHEGIFQGVREFALDALFVHILRNAVVDIQQGNGILADAGSDELAECSVDIYLTGYGDSSSGETAVYIAGNKAELSLKCRPAFSGDGHILAIAPCEPLPSQAG